MAGQIHDHADRSADTVYMFKKGVKNIALNSLWKLWLTSLRKVSLLFLASSLEVSASAVFVENYNVIIRETH